MSALVRWLPKLAVASADDIARFGPQAARVRSLLDFIPTMSDDAARASRVARGAAWDAADDAAWSVAGDAARSAASRLARGAARDAAWNAADDAAWSVAGDAARGAADAEVVSDFLSPENYRILTNPLAAGRAVDVLAPRYKDTPFRELLQELVSKRLITQPSDVLSVGRIARSPEDIVEIAMTLIADGVPVDEAYRMARLV